MTDENAIAVIGMSGRFPQAESVDKLWENLLTGKDCLQHFSKEELINEGISEASLESDQYVRVKGIIDSPNNFDTEFFDYTVKESMIMDPQARVFMEEVWKGIEDSGYAISKYKGRVGVYAGSGMNTYLLRAMQKGILDQYDDFNIMLGSDKDLLSTRVSYKLNLTGPSVAIQSTCSTSLVAVHSACQGLLSGDCDMAVAGGVSISYPIKQGYKYQDGMIFSKSGACRPFEVNSDGAVFSDGVGVVVLKRLDEAIKDDDDIYGVIKGTAINNDGNDKVGFTAPSVSGQAEVIKDCLDIADVPAESIQYIEAHGTATEIGDLLELKALSQVYGEETSKKNFCAIGSIKSNVGHLNTASGVAGLIKALLILKQGVVPPMAGFHKENPKLGLTDSHFFINQKLIQLDQTVPIRVAVSSFGIGGTNAHAILETAPIRKEDRNKQTSKEIFPFSAKTQKSLMRNMGKLSDWLLQNRSVGLYDIAKTLQAGRETFNLRQAVISESREDLSSQIQQRLKSMKLVKAQKRPVYFLVTGQGSQFVNMAKGLYERIGSFRDIVDKGFNILRSKYEADFIEVLYPDKTSISEAQEVIDNTEYAQPLIFIISYALGKYLMSIGIKPDKIIGHSLGEYVGACLSGVMTFEQGLEIVYWRGQYLQKADKGKMLAVRASVEDIAALDLDGVHISAVNAPKAVVVGGAEDKIAEAERVLSANKILHQALKTSHAFHTPMMEEAAKRFEAYLDKFDLKDPSVECISNTTARVVEKEQMSRSSYWKNHITNPVLFSSGVQQLLDGGEAVFIEIGSGKTLIDLAKQQASKEHFFVEMLPGRYSKEDQYSFFLEKLAHLWELGVSVEFETLQNGRASRIHMPTYQFDHQEFSIMATNNHSREGVTGDSSNVYSSNISRDRISAAYVEPRDEVEVLLLNLLKEIIGVENIGVSDNFFELGLSSLLASQYAGAIKESIDLEVGIQSIIESGCISELAEIVTNQLIAEG